MSEKPRMQRMLERMEWGLLLLLCTSGPLVATGLLLKRLSLAFWEIVGGLGAAGIVVGTLGMAIVQVAQAFVMRAMSILHRLTRASWFFFWIGGIQLTILSGFYWVMRYPNAELFGQMALLLMAPPAVMTVLLKGERMMTSKETRDKGS